MRTPTRDHHGTPMGSRSRWPDEIHVGDRITYATVDGATTGVARGRECNPYVEVWWVGGQRVRRRHITSHQPTSPAPTPDPGIPPQDRHEHNIRAFVQDVQHLGPDTARQQWRISQGTARAWWDEGRERGWVT